MTDSATFKGISLDSFSVEKSAQNVINMQRHEKKYSEEGSAGI
jgi:hypothetical protein